ncbi:MAG TPA: ribbon-helix-helix protein, CopG family [Tepidisphaeraceae bacterium]
MVAVAKKFRKVQISVRVNGQNLDRLDLLGDAAGRNRSEMVDRAIEDYIRAHASELPPPLPPPAKPHHKPRI